MYGFARAEDNVFTWDLMRTLGYHSNLPWLVVGDFNEILCNDDKSEGPRHHIGSIFRFREALVDCKLEHMGYFGGRFTWSNKFTKERLDKGLCSSKWGVLFPFSWVSTLPPSKLDHSLILVEGRTEPFCFAN